MADRPHILTGFHFTRATLAAFEERVEIVGRMENPKPTPADIPPGVINIVPAGRENADYILRHPGIDKISFTGSSAAGRHIAAVAAERLARTSFELTGNATQALGRRGRAHLRVEYFSDIITQQLYQQNVYAASRRQRQISGTWSGVWRQYSVSSGYQRNTLLDCLRQGN